MICSELCRFRCLVGIKGSHCHPGLKVSYILPADEYHKAGYDSSVSFYGETLGATIVAGPNTGVEELKKQ